MQFLVPDNPGTSVRFVGETVQRIPPSQAAVVALPVEMSWGPLGSELTRDQEILTDLEQIDALYGTTETPARRAAIYALLGAGVPDEPGAGGVLLYRIAATAKAKATRTLTCTATGTPDALKLDGLYHGTRGNDLSAVVEEDPADVTRDRLRILDRGATMEKFSYSPTDVAGLAAAINARSKWVRATSLRTGDALTPQSAPGLALQNGNDGAGATAGDVVSALDALAYKPFSLLSFPNLTDSAVQASVLSWTRAQAEEMRPVMFTVGGAANDTLSSAIARSTALADQHVVNLGVGQYRDDLFDRDVSTAELAPRVAGILAARGRTRSLTFAEIAGLTVVGDSAVAADELRSAWEAGVCVLRRTSSPDADLVINKGVTTFTNPSVASMPLDIFREPRHIRINDQFIREAAQWGDRNIVGDRPVNDDTRRAASVQLNKMLDELLSEGLIVPNSNPAPFVTVINTDNEDDPALRRSVPFSFGWRYAMTAENVVGLGRVR